MKAPGQVFCFLTNSSCSFWVKLNENAEVLQTKLTYTENVEVKLSLFLSVILIVWLNEVLEAFI